MMEMTPAHCLPEVGGLAVLPGPDNLEGWPVSERNNRSVVNPDAWFGDNIHGGRGLDSSLKRLWIFA